MKNRINATSAALSLVILFSTLTNVFAQHSKGEKNKFLENKKFNVQFYEQKASARGKAIPSLLFLKKGTIEADLMYEKLSLPPITYRITHDSTYTEDDTEMHVVNFEAAYSEGNNDYKWHATVSNYDIEGTIVQLKSGVEKKKFEFSGSEKTKK